MQITCKFRCRPPCFNGVVQSLTLPRDALVLRQEKGVIERVLQPKRDGGLCLILDLRPINRALGKHPFRMITLKQSLPRGLVCIRGFKCTFTFRYLCIILRCAFVRGHSVLVLLSPGWAGVSTTHFLEVPSERAGCTFSIWTIG